MEYQEFCSELKSQILGNVIWGIREAQYNFYPDGFTSTEEEELSLIRATNLKYHRIESDVLIGDYIILYIDDADDSGNSCRFSVKQLFGRYQKGGWESVLEAIGDSIELTRRIHMEELVNQLGNYAAVRDRFIIRPINYTDNRYDLKNVIYKQFGDIALVLYAIIYDNEMGLGTFKLQNYLLEEWKKDLEEVWEDALINANVMAPPRLYLNPLECYKAPYHRGAFMALNSEIRHIEKTQVPTITTTRQTNGAIAMFYPGVKERIAELFDDSFYVVFTSIHEVRVHHKDAVEPLTILRSLKSVNKAFDKEEILSRKVYFYEKESKDFRMLQL